MSAAKSSSRLLTHEGCTLVLYLVMSSLPIRLILYGLHYSCFSLFGRFFDEDDAADDDCRERERKKERMRKRRSQKTKRNHDGAFTDLTKQFKRLSCPFNALKRLAEEGRIAITKTPCLEWTGITQAQNQKVSFYFRAGANIFPSSTILRKKPTIFLHTH